MKPSCQRAMRAAHTSMVAGEYLMMTGGSIYTQIGYAREAAPDLVIDSEFQTVIVPCHPDRRTFP